MTPASAAHLPRLLILGASTRAAAWSAVRAGFQPVCADRFEDEDLHQVAEVWTLNRLQEHFLLPQPRPIAVAHLIVGDASGIGVLRDAPANWRAIGPRLGGDPALDGGSAWLALAPALSQQGLPTLPIALRDVAAGEPTSASRCGPTPFQVPADGTWMEKPLRSGGGRGVRRWDADAMATPLREPTFLQKYQPGQPMSAIYVAGAGGTDLVGLTQQLIGDPAASSPWPFGYCGSIAPVPLPSIAGALLLEIGRVATERLHLRGLFGVDFIWDGATPWPVEVNARYTAACELLELALRRPLLTEHWRACGDRSRPPPPAHPVVPRCGAQPPVLGKLIIYARSRVRAGDFSRFLRSRSPWSVPYLADIPRVDAEFAPGQPICTVYASGADAASCRRKLVHRADRVRRWLGDD